MKLSTKEKKSFLIGMNLGDSYLCKHPKGKNYYIVCTHNPKQYDYLSWKMENIKENLNKDYSIHSSKTHFSGKALHKGNIGKEYLMYRGVSRTHTLITKIRKEMYDENGKKIVTREILNQLTPLGLAIWYMDDGNLAYRKNDNGSIKSRNVTLHIQGFDSKSQYNIVNYFKESLGVECKLHKARDKYKLWMNTPNSIKFLKIVAPYVDMVECMRYKIDLKYEKKKVDLFN